MMQRMNRSTAWVSVALACVALLAVATVSQAGPPTLSTNPGRHAIFPARGQSPDQQRVDEAAAYDWATKQTGWDPYQAKAVLDQQSQGATEQAGAALGGAVKGGAGGALMGVAIGAIAGDAGKGAAIGATAGGMTGGMRSRRTMKAAGGSANAAAAAYQQQFQFWDRNFVAALEGMGYSVR